MHFVFVCYFFRLTHPEMEPGPHRISPLRHPCSLHLASSLCHLNYFYFHLNALQKVNSNLKVTVYLKIQVKCPFLEANHLEANHLSHDF